MGAGVEARPLHPLPDIDTAFAVMASSRVDFPEPFSPTKKVTGEVKVMLWLF